MECISRKADKESSSRRFAYYSWNGFTGDYLKSVQELFRNLPLGLVNDMYAENSNDDYKGYKEVATQEDFDKF